MNFGLEFAYPCGNYKARQIIAGIFRGLANYKTRQIIAGIFRGLAMQNTANYRRIFRGLANYKTRQITAGFFGVWPIAKHGKLLPEFFGVWQIAKPGKLPLEFFGVRQITAAIFKNESKLQFPKIVTKAYLKNGISYL